MADPKGKSTIYTGIFKRLKEKNAAIKEKGGGSPGKRIKVTTQVPVTRKKG